MHGKKGKGVNPMVTILLVICYFVVIPVLGLLFFYTRVKEEYNKKKNNEENRYNEYFSIFSSMLVGYVVGIVAIVIMVIKYIINNS